VALTPAVMIEGLAAQHPDLRLLLDEHMSDNFNELLPHVFFGDVTRWTEAQPPDSAELHQLLDELDHYLAEGDEDVYNVISVSYIENFWNRRDILMAMGPVLRSSLMWKHMMGGQSL